MLKLIRACAGTKLVPSLVIILFAALGPTASCADEDRGNTPGFITLPKEGGIRWKSLLGNTLTFLTVSHAFRWAKEEYTRDATLHGPFFQGWGAAVGNVHGWADGDEFLCNYVGHSMGGAVAGYIFSHNDPKYRGEEFGQNLAYWRGKSRGFVFSALYSALFEIGPMSEADVGKIQSYWPQQGMVDWVITPTVGLAWSLAEDALDKYIAKPFEGKVHNPALRAIVRGWLNPSRSFANIMMFKYPWHRDTRSGIRTYEGKINTDPSELRGIRDAAPAPLDPADPYGRKNANFTFDVPFEVTSFGKLNCVGGGVNAQLPLNNSLDAVINLTGCKMTGLPTNYSGDSLTYMIGARWSPKSARRTVPYVRFMAGGHKITEERLFPDLKKELLAEGVKGTYYRDVHYDYTQSWRKNGFAVSMGAGVDLGINRALGLRLVSVDYLHSWLSPMNGVEFHDGLRLSSGLIVHMGSW